MKFLTWFARTWLEILSAPVHLRIARWLPQWMLASPGETEQVNALRRRLS